MKFFARLFFKKAAFPLPKLLIFPHGDVIIIVYRMNYQKGEKP